MFLFSIGCILLLGFYAYYEQLCSMVHLVGFSRGLFHGRLPDALWVLVFFYSFGHQGMVCGRSPRWFASLLVTLLCYIGAHCGFSPCRLGVGYALRVPPVVTRLTVYRRPQVGLPELRICLSSGTLALHVVLYMYILEFLPSGMSIASLDICRDLWSNQC